MVEEEEKIMFRMPFDVAVPVTPGCASEEEEDEELIG